MSARVQVALVEDYLLFRQGLVSFLRDEEEINILFQASNGKELIDQLLVQQPNVIIMDIRMPVMDGRTALGIIRRKYPAIRVIMLSMHYSDQYVSEFFTAGAAAFLPKNCSPEKLIQAIYTVYEQGHYYDDFTSKIISDLVKTKLPGSGDYTPLTTREIEILRLLCTEKTIPEIGDQLEISSRTVEWHQQNIFEKTASKTRVGLVMYAIRMGIIPNPEDLFN
jgi:DNA-binding NarL/FixJ family response regulator